MTFLRTYAGRIRWIERLALDAVLVALAWGWALSQAVDGRRSPETALVLGLATWLTYLADRLRDSRPGVSPPATDRHAFSRRYWKGLSALWGMVFLLTATWAHLRMPGWKLAGGWLLAGCIVAYLGLLFLPLKGSTRLLAKRLVVPLVFTAGTAWMAEAWRTPSGRTGVLVLFLGAMLNLFIISHAEARKADLRLLARRGAVLSWAALAMVVAAGLVLDRTEALAASPGLVLFGLLARGNLAAEEKPVRLCADGILVLMALSFGILVCSG